MKKNKTIEATCINASLVSAQNRKRLFWVGKLVGDTYEKVDIEQPEDKGILLRDILEQEVDEKYYLNSSAIKTLNRDSYGAKGSISEPNGKTKTLTASAGGGGGNGIHTTVRIGSLNQGGQGDRIYSQDGKSVNLSANGGGRGAKTGLYSIKEFVRKLTPLECERLQSLTEKEQSCIIKVCLDHQNNYVNVGNKNLKSQIVVGIAEKKDLKENVLSAEKSLNTNNPQTSKPAQPDVLISCEENTLQIHYQNKLLVNVSGADWKQNVHHLKKIEDFVHLVVGINTIVEKITNGGEAELHQKNNISIAVENGNNVVSIYGKGITQLANDVEKDSITLNKLLKFTISDLSIQENKEQITQTLFSYVVNAILGFIPKEIQNQNTLTFQINSSVGYTWGISNTQRYKALGNGFNCKVIEHIINSLK